MRPRHEPDRTSHAARTLVRTVRARLRDRPHRPVSGSDGDARATIAGPGTAGGRGESLEGCPVAAETWRRLAKLTVARRFIALLILLVLPMGSQSVLDAALAPPTPAESAVRGTARIGLGVLAVGGTSAFVLGLLARDLRRRRLVSAHDGRLDPLTLEPILPGLRRTADARAYWWTWLVTAESPAVYSARTGTCFDGADDPDRPPSRVRAGLAMFHPRGELAIPAALLLVVPSLIALLAGRSPLTAALVPGVAFLALAVVRGAPWLTVAAELPLRRCHRCDQPVTRDTQRCSECGRDIDPSQLRAARPRPARRVGEVIVATIGLCWLAGVLAGGPLARALRTNPAVPSASLLADLSGAPVWDSAAFRSLVMRSPDSATNARLAELILQRRRAGVRVGAEAWTWFDAAVRDGRLATSHDQERWRDSVEPLRLVPVVLSAEAESQWGGVAVTGSPPVERGPGFASPHRLALRFVRRFDAADGRRTGLIVIGVYRPGDQPTVPRRIDGSLCLVAAGERPLRSDWLPAAERRERPWPAPPEYVMPLPPLPVSVHAAVERGDAVVLDVIRFVAPPGAGPIRVEQTAAGHRLTSPVIWQVREQIVLAPEDGPSPGVLPSLASVDEP